LGDSEKYSPISDIEIEDVRFVYRQRPGKKDTVAYGTHKIINNVFVVEVLPGPILSGTSTGGKTTLGKECHHSYVNTKGLSLF